MILFFMKELLNGYLNNYKYFQGSICMKLFSERF